MLIRDFLQKHKKLYCFIVYSMHVEKQMRVTMCITALIQTDQQNTVNDIDLHFIDVLTANIKWQNQIKLLSD